MRGVSSSRNRRGKYSKYDTIKEKRRRWYEMARGWTKFKKADVLKAIQGSGGIKMEICKRLNCDRGTLDRYIARFADIAQAIEREVEDVGDIVEAKIITGIREGNTTLMIFYAKTKLKHRGYVERQEIESTQPIIVRIDEDDAKG
jgi:hypothetical protein